MTDWRKIIDTALAVEQKKINHFVMIDPDCSITFCPYDESLPDQLFCFESRGRQKDFEERIDSYRLSADSAYDACFYYLYWAFANNHD